MSTGTDTNVRNFLKDLSTQDFLRIGVNEIAYVRPMAVQGGSQSVGIYAADGTKLGVTESKAHALEALRNNDLMLVTLQ
jgi:hypothetical protein